MEKHDKRDVWIRIDKGLLELYILDFFLNIFLDLREPIEGQYSGKYNRFMKVPTEGHRLLNTFRYGFYDISDGGGVMNGAFRIR